MPLQNGKYCLCFHWPSDLTGETGGVQAWTYNYSVNQNLDWDSARQWCRQHYTDMVAIQNQEEIVYLNTMLPRNSQYYWIGLRKVGFRPLLLY